MDRGRGARERVDSPVRYVRVKAYVVGGAVRDELLGLPVQDQRLRSRRRDARGDGRAGASSRSARTFPVFLHPKTHEEYALARTERKSGRGYKGFTVHAAPDVTLEDDLRRRDLTINAMAKDRGRRAHRSLSAGRQDLEGEDPAPRQRGLRRGSGAHPARGALCRALRLSRRRGDHAADAARWCDSGEADYLVPERVWQEFSRGLAEPHPERMFEVLRGCGRCATSCWTGSSRFPSF